MSFQQHWLYVILLQNYASWIAGEMQTINSLADVCFLLADVCFLCDNTSAKAVVHGTLHIICRVTYSSLLLKDVPSTSLLCNVCKWGSHKVLHGMAALWGRSYWFSAQKRHSDRFMETCFLSWDYSDEGIKLDCSFPSSSELKNSWRLPPFLLYTFMVWCLDKICLFDFKHRSCNWVRGWQF